MKETINRPIKRLILMLVDAVSIVVSVALSYNFSDFFTDFSATFLIQAAVFLLVVYLLLGLKLKIFSILTRYTSSRNLLAIGLSLLVAHVLLILFESLQAYSISYRFVFLSFVFSFVLSSLPRIAWRVYNEKTTVDAEVIPSKKTLLVGAGAGGNLFLSMTKSGASDIDVVGIVDKDKNKHNTYLHGKKIIGDRSVMQEAIRDLGVEQVIIAIPSLAAAEREKILDICSEAGVPVKNMPSVEDVMTGKVSTSNLKEIDIADLLGRKEVVLDQSSMGDYFAGKTVLVTGAGGSIGSEICRQVLQFSPKRLILLGHGENSIYLIHREVLEQYGKNVDILPVIADIQDRKLIGHLMAEYKPDIVYHAAAHKHVPLMEFNPREAVKNNVYGTRNVAEAAKAAGVGKFVMVSTDKAVNPPNVMGASKRIAEMIVTNLNEHQGTQFCAVRFGNVLGSRGSVVPVFKDQVAKGGPVTVTDFRMTRYFMTIPEASRLVIQAGCLAQGGEIFVLDMGEPVFIRDLAKKVIKLSGHTEEEIEIVESGIRPGEKLYEELLTTDERVDNKVHEKIFIGKTISKSTEEIEGFLSGLEGLSEQDMKKQMIAFAKQE